MPDLTISFTSEEFEPIKSRAVTSQMTPENFVRATMIDSTSPGRMRLETVARALSMPKETILRILAELPTRASQETIDGVRAAASEMNYTPSIPDIACVAEVSPMAVSLAINGIIGTKGVSEKTAERILDLCKKLGWKRNLTAENLRRKRN